MEYVDDQTKENMQSATLSHQISTFNIVMTAISAFMRFLTIIMNCCLAYEYWRSASYTYCHWTIMSILIPMILTTIIYANVLIVGHPSKKPVDNTRLFWRLVVSFLFRDASTLNWALKYTEAKRRGDKIAEIECYRRHLMEECNIGFLRLFDSFLETAPQKVLQLAIVLQNTKSLTYVRTFTFLVYFLSLAWCLVAYNRSNRLVQLDKYDIGAKGLFVQFWFLLCLTASRTICIAYLASIFPMETFAVCILHMVLCGTILFIADTPKFGKSPLMNYILCLSFGAVYIFIFTPVSDGPTNSSDLLLS
ncbi:XK-related protein 4 isoform X3 [Drosophila hydei]|uniref:XK-related protein n=1 Tax=Drosophila hydei TaxID=7224 RepID=A0A6J1LGQ1_DROHY|nr:XK-related protein 4 isoform X3 [Drosophila hydei]